MTAPAISPAPRTIPCSACGVAAHIETDPIRQPGHYSPLPHKCEADRRCPTCQNWLDRYGRCLQCAEPAGEL